MKLSTEFKSIPHVYRDNHNNKTYRGFMFNGNNADILSEFGIDDYSIDGSTVIIDKYRLPKGYWIISTGLPDWEIVPNSYMTKMEVLV